MMLSTTVRLSRICQHDIINDSMFIEYLSRWRKWRQYNVTLLHNNACIILVAC